MSVRPPEQGWFEKAEKDIEMARRAMDPEGPIPEMACYHSQQCAEKYRKGYRDLCTCFNEVQVGCLSFPFL